MRRKETLPIPPEKELRSSLLKDRDEKSDYVVRGRGGLIKRRRHHEMTFQRREDYEGRNG